MTGDPVGVGVSVWLLIQRRGTCGGRVVLAGLWSVGCQVRQPQIGRSADRQAGAFAGVAVSMVDEEAGRAGELVSLLRHDPHRELLPGQIRSGQLEAFRGVGLLDIDHRGLRLAVSLFQYLQGVLDHRVGSCRGAS